MTALLIICTTLVMLAIIAALTVTMNGCAALAKAEPEDVPEVVAGMGRLLIGFRIFIPRGHLDELTARDQSMDSAGSTSKLGRGV